MIYLDYAAGAPLSKEAAKVFQHLSTEVYGNASGLHDAGGRAADVLEYCRHSAGKLIGGAADGIYFTSGGTEANILAVQSFFARPARPQKTFYYDRNGTPFDP